MLAVPLGAVVDGADCFGDVGDLFGHGLLLDHHGGEALLNELPVFALGLFCGGVAADEAVLDEADEPHEDEHTDSDDSRDGDDTEGGPVRGRWGAQDEPHEEEGGGAGRDCDGGDGFRGRWGTSSLFRHSGTPSGRCTDSECASTNFQNT